MCLAGVLTALLICWHREIVHGFHLMKRRADVRVIMNVSGHNSGYRYDVRGPLTIGQVEVEIFRRPLQSGDVNEMPVNADFVKAWNEFRGSYEAGDELYFVNSDRRSWEQLVGWRGYVLIRKNRVMNSLVTFLN